MLKVLSWARPKPESVHGSSTKYQVYMYSYYKLLTLNPSFSFSSSEILLFRPEISELPWKERDIQIINCLCKYDLKCQNYLNHTLPIHVVHRVKLSGATAVRASIYSHDTMSHAVA